MCDHARPAVTEQSRGALNFWLPSQSSIACSCLLVSCSFFLVFIHTVHSFVHSFTFIHSLIDSFIHSLIHSFIHSLIHSSFLDLFIFILSFIHLFILSFVRSLIHSLQMSVRPKCQWYQNSSHVTASVQLKPEATRSKVTADFEENYCAIYDGGMPRT